MRALSRDSRYRVVRNLIKSPGGVTTIKPDGTTTDTYVDLDGGLGGMRNGMVAGHTYVASGTVDIPASWQSSNTNSRNRTVSVYWRRSGGSDYVRTGSDPGVVGASTRVSLGFVVPDDATQVFIRLYNGSDDPDSAVEWSEIMLTEGDTLYEYRDGDSPGWVWDGEPNASTSRGWVFVP